jgi:protein-S-isoprenylcysteine O-methyltransferase Ste14
VFVLARRFSGLVAIQPGHTLVTTDVYRVIRHPSYLGLLTYRSVGPRLSFLDRALLTGLMIPPLLARIQSEKGRLQQHFGSEYDAYRARTSRMIPWIY